MIIAGIDPGTRCMGLSLFSTDDLIITGIDSYTIVASDWYKNDPTINRLSDLSQQQRLYGIIRQLMNIVLKHNVNIFAIESPYFTMAHPNAFKSLVLAIDSIKYALNSEVVGASIIDVAPLEAKSAVKVKNVKGVPTKTLVKNAISKNTELNRFILVDDYSEHALDAVAIGYSYLIKLRQHAGVTL